MAGWPRLRESRTVRTGRVTGMTVRCGLTDTTLAEVPVAVVFCYERAVDDDALAKGLSTALDVVPLFAGRVDRDGDRLVITCDDSGVPMTTYDVDDTLGDAMNRVTMPGSGLVDPVNVAAGDDQLLRVRVHRLADGGMTIGCSWHHAVGDMRSFMALMRAWSAAVAGLPLPEVSIVPDRDAYLDTVLPPADCGRPGFRLADETEAAGVRRVVEQAQRANRTVQIYFSATETSRMRDHLSAEAGRELSTNDVLCAHVITALRHIAGDQDTHGLVVPVDLRRHLGVPADVIGNLVGDIYLNHGPDTTAPQLATALREAVRQYPTEHLNIRASRTFLASVDPGRLADCFPVGFDPAHGTASVTNWCRFGVYDVTFDGCPPTLVSSAPQLLLPWVCWLIEGFAGRGFLYTAMIPAKLAARSRGAAAQATLHAFRPAEDQRPSQADMVRKLV